MAGEGPKRPNGQRLSRRPGPRPFLPARLRRAPAPTNMLVNRSRIGSLPNGRQASCMSQDPDEMPKLAHPERPADVERLALLDRLARLYTRPLSQFFRRRLSNPSDIPDLVQDVFLGLSRMPDPARIDRPETFLFVAAANVLRDRNRRDATHQANRHDEYDDAVDRDSGFSPERVLQGRQEIARVRAALMVLPTRTRDAFVLRVFEELSMGDVAAALGVSVRAAEKHCAKALAHVQSVMEDPRHPPAP